MPRKPRGLRTLASLLTPLLRSFLVLVARCKIFHVKVSNQEVIPETGRTIVASSHQSVADPVVLWGAMPRKRKAVAIAMAELWRMPGINLLMWALGHIPVKRGNRASGQKALAAGQRILEADGLLFIYPEGKCSKTGELLPFKRGVADLAFATGAPVIPAGINGSNQVKPLDTWRIHRTPQITLRFGEALDPAHFTGEDRVEAFLAELRQRIALLMH
jgi:1-acyl-sn-glycerol-3-phosphate acyltransferase